jgi:hypothetical protein
MEDGLSCMLLSFLSRTPFKQLQREYECSWSGEKIPSPPSHIVTQHQVLCLPISVPAIFFLQIHSYKQLRRKTF